MPTVESVSFYHRDILCLTNRALFQVTDHDEGPYHAESLAGPERVGFQILETIPFSMDDPPRYQYYELPPGTISQSVSLTPFF